MKRMCSFFVTMILLLSVAWSQISHGGTPISLSYDLRSEVPTYQLPVVDTAPLLKEDAEADEYTPFRFGVEIPMNINLENSGVWETSDAGTTWRVNISAPEAYSLSFRFDEFSLPIGAQLFLYTRDYETTIGAFTHENNKLDGKFATASVPGNFVTIELTLANLHDEVDFNIMSSIYGYKDIFNSDGGRSQWCENNVNCPEGEPWVDDKRAVVKLEVGWYLCSGSMINNVNEDGTPYLYTAYHCIEDSGSPSYWVFRFKYESSTCYGDYGPTNYSTVGSIVRSTSNDIYNSPDFALLELTDDIPENYEVYYSGWTRSTAYPQEPVGIHHPDGDIKKISFDYDNATHYNTNKWNVSWDDGVTEGGSSGSPLYDNTHRIVGSLSTGCSSCDEQQCPDQYGKLYRSWDYGSTADTRLRDWLDPDDTDIEYLDGFDPNNPSGIMLGDINLDETINVQDIILVVNFIMGNTVPDDYQIEAADLNEDDIINVLDVIALVSVVLGETD